MFGSRIGFLLDCPNVSLDRLKRRLLTLHEILHKPWRAPLRDIQYVIQHQNLAIDLWTGSNSDDRYFSIVSNCFANFVGNTFQQQQICPCPLQLPGTLDHLLGFLGIPTLHFESADLVYRLWPQPSVCAHGNIVLRQMFDNLNLAIRAFEFDHHGATTLHHLYCIIERLHRLHVAHERHVAHEEGAL